MSSFAHVFNVFYMFQYDYVIIKNTTNIFTSLYYILQSITLSVLHITVTSTNETISKFTSTIKHVSISASGMLIMVSITIKYTEILCIFYVELTIYNTYIHISIYDSFDACTMLQLPMHIAITVYISLAVMCINFTVRLN